MNPYQEFIYKRSYSRWIEDEKRRESWDETVNRYKEYFETKVPLIKLEEFYLAIKEIENLQVMPSMRCLWTAGPALDNDNIAGYNCAYTVIDKPIRFAEILYILMNGTGIGFSTEQQYINQLPEVSLFNPPNTLRLPVKIVFEDSKLGWADGFNTIIHILYQGSDVNCDYSKLRPKGARLKTFGGKSSGPEPLKELVEFTRATFKAAQGRKLTSLECYDIVCKIANCVVSGGVRRSATINISDINDLDMRAAKEGTFWIGFPQRQLSNNSVAYKSKPSSEEFLEEWISLIRSKSGERGIVNRPGLQLQIPSRRICTYDFGVNPCGEIILRPFQFCNLTEVVVRPEDNLETLCNKVKYATILGCLQSTLTNFKFLSPEWKKNCEEERLLGVSLTGLMTHPILNRVGSIKEGKLAPNWLSKMKQIAINTAEEWSKILNINMPTAITCIKPSGTVSQFVNTSSGIHSYYAAYFIRRVRVTVTDALAKFLLSKGVDAKPEIGQTWENCNTVVFDFPIKAPEGSVYRNDRTALEQLDYWKMLKIYWCEHNPSCTIYVKDDEWLSVGAWVYDNWDIIGGLSFLPFDGGLYELAPYEEITKEQYEKLISEFPKLDFTELTAFEQEDESQGSREFACVSGACEL